MKETHMLYPIVETETEVPLGMVNSVYTLPEVPIIGFVRGRTSSSIGARTISTAIGLFLKISCARTERISPSFRDVKKKSGEPL